MWVSPAVGHGCVVISRICRWDMEMGKMKTNTVGNAALRVTFAALVPMLLVASTALCAGPPASGPRASSAVVSAPVAQALSQGSQDSSSGLEPAYIVVAVDESLSITDGEMRQEKDAATSILLDEFNPGSQVEVIGFGGEDGEASPSNPENNTVCPMTSVQTPVQRQSVENCISGFAVRQPGEGENTDFIHVVNQAVSDLKQAPQGYQRLLFLLTDGTLDVWGGPDYTGPSKSAVNAAALNTLNTVSVPAAAAAEVSIWGLGFGPDASLSELQYLAQHSYADGCAAGGNRADVIPDTTTLNETLLAKLYATARCSSYDPGALTTLRAGSVEIPVTVPPIATSGAIEVITGNAQDQVSFRAPNGQQAPASGKVDDTVVQVEGTGGLVQSLQLTDPTPGTWVVVVSAPPGQSQNQQIEAGVLWQGRVESDLVLSTYQPIPGEQVTVTVQISARPSVTLTSQMLSGVQVTAGLSGTGFAPIRSVALDPVPSNAGYFTGALTVPKTATGNLAFTGFVSGSGVAADERQTFTAVRSATSTLTATLAEQSTTVQAGASMQVALQLDNESGTAHDLTITLEHTPVGVTEATPTVHVSEASGARKPIDLSISVASTVPTGRIGGTLSVIDAATGLKYYSIFLSAQVVQPPTLVERYFRLILSVIVLLVLLAIAVPALIIRHRNGISVAGITVVLYDDRAEEIERLPAPMRRAPRFPFSVLRGSQDGTAWMDASAGRLAHDESGGWSARRRGSGVVVKTSDGMELSLLRGEPTSIGDGLQLGYEDERAPKSSASSWLPGSRRADKEPVTHQESSEEPGLV